MKINYLKIHINKKTSPYNITMFGFINDYLKKFDLKDNNFRLVFIDNSFVCVQGFKSVLKISEEEIVLKILNGELLIVGEKLNIRELGKEEILISGDIFKVERG